MNENQLLKLNINILDLVISPECMINTFLVNFIRVSASD